MHVVNATAVQVTISLNITSYIVSQYCVNLTRISVSNLTDNTPILTIICSTNRTVTFSPVEEDATYQFTAVVNNTAGVQSRRSVQATVTTKPARKCTKNGSSTFPDLLICAPNIQAQTKHRH